MTFSGREYEGARTRWTLGLMIWLLGVGVAGAEVRGFVRAEGTRLLLEGREYRAIGVNVPHLSQGYMGTWFHWREIYGTQEKMRQAIVDAIVDAAQHRLAFIRFFAHPGYPKDTAELYWRDKEAYWRQMDELLALCRKHRIRLVPCLGAILRWHHEAQEPMTAIADPESKTHQLAYGYIQEFVSRYKDDPVILMWELDNEAFLRADVDQEGRANIPRGCFPPNFVGYREKLSRADSLRFDMLVRVYKEMASFIKKLDPNHLVTSGDSGVRRESVSRRETFPHFQYRTDTLREHLAHLLMSQPEPLDVFSIHAYGSFEGTDAIGPLPHLEYLRARVRALHAARAPVFVGELGQQPPFGLDPEAQWTRAAIEVLEEEGVALIALWVWHFPWQDRQHLNIPCGAAQPRLMERVAAFNARWAGL